MLTGIQYVMTPTLQHIIIVRHLQAIVLIQVEYLRWHVIDGVVMVGERDVLMEYCYLVLVVEWGVGVGLYLVFLLLGLLLGRVQIAGDWLLWLLLLLINLLEILLGLLV